MPTQQPSKKLLDWMIDFEENFGIKIRYQEEFRKCYLTVEQFKKQNIKYAREYHSKLDKYLDKLENGEKI